MSEHNSPLGNLPIAPVPSNYYVLMYGDNSLDNLKISALIQPEQIVSRAQISSILGNQILMYKSEETTKTEQNLSVDSTLSTLQNEKCQELFNEEGSTTSKADNIRNVECKGKSKAVRTSKRIEGKQEQNKKAETQKEIIKNKRETKPLHFYFHIADREIAPRALAVLPTALLFRQGHIFPQRRPIPPRTRFGPVQGVTDKVFQCEGDEYMLEAALANKPVFLLRRDEESVSVTHIDVSNKERSNWFSLLPLGTASTANVWLYEQDNELYGVTTKIIPLRVPLALGYSKQYAENHHIPQGQPVLDLEEALSEHGNEWWCFECQRGFSSATLLQRHISVYHREKPVRRMYRCTFCSKAFTRIFALRRHTAGICSKKHTKSETARAKISRNDPETFKKDRDIPELTLSQSAEDTRIPSDESFQIYTNGLDISTNLFDPDKIANIDISGNSKSESDFNYYSSDPKLDGFGYNLDYKSFSEGLQDKNIKEENKSISDDQVIVNCPHCDRTMTKAKKRRHLRECPSRKHVCVCDRVFRRKQDLAQHIFAEHNELAQNTNLSEDEIKQEADSDKLQLKCDDCKLSFKRRGMLVNHLWRVHNVQASLPVERRVRHYPCTVCPNLYRSAAKRDAHVRKYHPVNHLWRVHNVQASLPIERRVQHYPCTVCANLYRSAAKRDAHVRKYHPGVHIRAAPIEGERTTCEAAKCPECPRQYGTRAKLLQHMRAAHPGVDLSAKKSSTRKTPQKNIKSARSTIKKLPRNGIL